MKTKQLLLMVLLGSIFQTQAKTITILFGGATGMKYSPDSVEANVGDNIRWEGSFSSHPLVSTSVPAGANSISVSTGTSFEYTISIAGDYRFKCDVHNFSGVVKASASVGVKSTDLSETHLYFSNQSKCLTVKKQNLENTATVIILNDFGQTVFRTMISPEDNTPLNLRFLKSGVYLAYLTIDDKINQFCRFMITESD